MIQWRPLKRVAEGDPIGETGSLIPFPVVKEEQVDDEEPFSAESLTSSESGKKRCITISQLVGPRTSKRDRKPSVIFSSKCKQIKKEEAATCKRRNSVSGRKDASGERWSMERYKVAEKNMLEVMKAEGAAIDKPISRPVLRAAARKFIGDTGLLDHLLKHIDGKIAPGGTERFRRCYNTEGIMEYWLENADLVDIKRRAGVPDPNWVPPSWSKSSTVGDRETSPPDELAFLKEEISKMKRIMEERIIGNCNQDLTNRVEEMHKELMKLRMNTDQRLMDISNSIRSMQEMNRELFSWKYTAEQQITEISNSLNSITGVSSNFTNFNSSDKWEDWLENTSLEPLHADDFTSWFESSDPVNVCREVSVRESSQVWMKPDNFCQSVEELKKEVAKMKRDMQEMVPRRVDDEQAKLTPDSSVTVNSKSDHSDSVFQEMLMDLMKWKAKMDQQMQDISSRVNSLQASKHRLT